MLPLANCQAVASFTCALADRISGCGNSRLTLLVTLLESSTYRKYLPVLQEASRRLSVEVVPLSPTTSPSSSFQTNEYGFTPPEISAAKAPSPRPKHEIESAIHTRVIRFSLCGNTKTVSARQLFWS